MADSCLRHTEFPSQSPCTIIVVSWDVMCADILSVFCGQFLGLQSGIVCMLLILGIITPFQIADIVVQPVTILVVDLRKVVRIWDECFSNQTVDMFDTGLMTGIQRYPYISVRCQTECQ